MFGRSRTKRLGLARRVFLMCDWTAEPLWDLDTGYNLSLDDLPLTRETKAALRRWARAWDELASKEFVEHTEEETHNGVVRRDASDWVAHRTEGDRLWAVVRNELGEGWAVARDRWFTGRLTGRWVVGRRKVVAWTPEDLARLQPLAEWLDGEDD